jgi:hypothetical protein
MTTSPRFAILLLLLCAAALLAQVIPTDRRIDWSAGIPGGIPAVSSPLVNVRTYGALGDGASDDQPAFIAAMNALPANGGVVFIPAGTYLLRSNLTIDKPVVLRGEGMGATTLIFDLAGQALICIQVVTYGRGTWVAMSSGYQKGSTAVVVANAAGFSAGTIVETQQDNDSALMYTDTAWIQSWAEGAVGQFNRCTAVRGDTLILERPLYMTYRAGLNPVIRTQRLVSGAGIEAMCIRRRDAGDGETIVIKNAANCWVACVEGDSTMRGNVVFESVWRCEVRNCYFHNAHDYGGGGHGYGVVAGLHTTDCLIENNLFVHLRHSMMAHVGASGCVFGYNYSREPYVDESWTPCDISMHGHYGNYNLFEGNTVQEIDYADYWGPMGPGNTVFRNKVEAEGIDVLDHSHFQNVVGNVLGSGMDTIYVAAGVDSTLVHGNVVNGATRWDPAIADHSLPASLYLTSKPAFLAANSWPVFGPDVAAGAKLPAQVRWETSSFGCAAVQGARPAAPGSLRSADRKADLGTMYDLRGARQRGERVGRATGVRVVVPAGALRRGRVVTVQR